MGAVDRLVIGFIFFMFNTGTSLVLLLWTLLGSIDDHADHVLYYVRARFVLFVVELCS